MPVMPKNWTRFTDMGQVFALPESTFWIYGKSSFCPNAEKSLCTRIYSKAKVSSGSYLIIETLGLSMTTCLRMSLSASMVFSSNGERLLSRPLGVDTAVIVRGCGEGGTAGEGQGEGEGAGLRANIRLFWSLNICRWMVCSWWSWIWLLAGRVNIKF